LGFRKLFQVNYFRSKDMGSKKKGAVEIIALQCTECKRKNYTTYKNRKNITGKLEKNKYCPFCKKSILHKETKAK
jgi:large subunit ribosomal protein L33